MKASGWFVVMADAVGMGQGPKPEFLERRKVRVNPGLNAKLVLLVLLITLPCFAQVGPVRVVITPGNTAIAVGASQQLIATISLIGNRSGGTDVTNEVTWQSSDATIASISSTGMVTANASNRGTVTITAIRGPFRASTTLTVIPSATLTSVTIAPVNPSIPKGLTQSFTLTGHFGVTDQDVTAAASWSSSDLTVAAIVAPGHARGLKQGSSATIMATFSGHSDSTLLTVTAPILQSVVVGPSNPTIPLGINQQFSATAVFSDNSTQTVTNLAAWASTNSTTATINNTGLATSQAIGSTTISATYSAVTGSTTLTVAAPALVSIAVTPVNPSVHPGTSLQLTATGTYTNGTNQNITNSVSWSSNNTAVASVSSSGLLSAVNAGGATISATGNGFGGAQVTGTTTVSVPALVSIAVNPALPTVPQGGTLQLNATGTYSDASTMDLTNRVTWTSSNPTMVSVNSTGLITGNAVGFSTITARLGTISGSAVALTGFSQVSLNGHYAFSVTGADNNGEFLAAGSFQADGNGNIFNGIEDFNGGAPPPVTTNFTGTYTVGIDGRGSATLSTGETLKFVMTASGSAVVIQFNNLAVASGTVSQQDANAFQNLQGDYAFQLSGLGTNGAIADVGIFTADGAGNILNGKDDFNYTGSVGNGTSSGAFTGVDSHGRGTMTWHFNDGSSFHFSYYIIDHDQINLASVDFVPAFLGVAHRRSSQTSTTNSLDSFYVFSESGVTTTDKFQHTSLFNAAGVFRATGGVIDDGRQDSNEGGSVSENAAVSGTYGVSSNGRGTATINGFPYVFYMATPSLAYFMNTDSGAVLTRTARSQPAILFSTNLFQGYFNLLLSGEDLVKQSFLAMSGQMIADGSGTLSGTEDVNDNGTLSANVPLNGAYSVEADGRGTGSINGPNGTLTIHFYMVNTDEAVFVETDSNNDQIGSARVQF